MSEHVPDVVYEWDGANDLPYCDICQEPISLETDGEQPTPRGMYPGEYWAHIPTSDLPRAEGGNDE